LRRSDPVYLDFMASTPVDASVIDVMAEAMRETWGNPHSDHAHGFQASKIVDQSKEAIAALLGADPDEILFTSGATEANNLAVKGVMTSAARRGNHLVVTSIEHKCVLEAAYSLSQSGVEVTEVQPDTDGLVSAEAVAQALRPDTALVSVMHANNETGVLQPVREIAEICHQYGILFHTDAAQTVGKIDVDFDDIDADLLSFSGHKFYGPKGIGGLIVSRAAPFQLVPQLDGGGQQPLGRSGTVPAPLCAGLAAATRLYERHGQSAGAHIQSLQRLFEDRMARDSGPFIINSHAERIPGCTSLRADGVNAEDILLHARSEISASTGSACNSGSIEPSYVLMAQGLTFEEASASMRIGIGRTTTEADIDRAVLALFAAHETAYRAAA
jgi:cysteine desulfurase|tara:strand:+ start:2805 stop:3962 length:1158 start_codon:yes stop_codon:yes gene_type:complete